MRKEYEIDDYPEYPYFKKRKQLEDDPYPTPTDWNKINGGDRYDLLRLLLYLYGAR